MVNKGAKEAKTRCNDHGKHSSIFQFYNELLGH